MVARQTDNTTTETRTARVAQRVQANGNGHGHGEAQLVQHGTIAQAAEAVVDVVKAAQRMIVARIDLVQLQAKDALTSAGMFVGAGVIALLGWIALMAAAVAALHGPVPLGAALAIVGGAHVTAALIIALVAKRKMTPGHSTLSPQEPAESRRERARAERSERNERTPAMQALEETGHLRGLP